MSNSKYDHLFKLVIVGDAQVGKTCLFSKYCCDSFSDQYCPTIGVEFCTKIINLEGKVCKLQMWDTAGQERFRTIITSYYRGAQGIIITYDVTDENSLIKIREKIKEVEHYAQENVRMALVGNKCERTDRKVSFAEGQKLAKEFNMQFFEASAKTNYNVNEIFTSFAREILNNINKQTLIPSVDLNKETNQTKVSDDLNKLVKGVNEININNDANTTQTENTQMIQENKQHVDSEPSFISKYLIQLEELTFYKDKIGQNEKIGSGSFGNVYLGEYYGSKVAIKEIEFGLNGIKKEDILKEVDIMLSIRHSNNCLIYGYVELQNKIMIVMEFYNDGSLFNVLSYKTKDVDIKMKKSLLLQIAQGINYLHSRKPPIIHKELKPENIFLTNGFSRAVIGDFGLYKHIDSKDHVGTFAGTILWMAPEMLNGSNYGLKSDVYSFGIVMYEVLTRSRPFENVDLNNLEDIKKRVLGGERPDLNTNKLFDIEHELIILMKNCWNSNPEQRPDFKEIIEKLSNLI